MDLINRQNILNFPYLSTSGTEEALRDIAWRNVPEDVFYDNEEYLMNMCWEVIESFLNVVRTEPAVKAKPEVEHICDNCIYYEKNEEYCEKLECDEVANSDGCNY